MTELSNLLGLRTICHDSLSTIHSLWVIGPIASSNKLVHQDKKCNFVRINFGGLPRAHWSKACLVGLSLNRLIVASPYLSRVISLFLSERELWNQNRRSEILIYVLRFHSSRRSIARLDRQTRDPNIEPKLTSSVREAGQLV